MKLERDHHAILDVLDDADEPLTIPKIAHEADLSTGQASMRLTFLNRHGFAEKQIDNTVVRYARGDRGRTE